MTILSLEDSKALYDAGIKIETKLAWQKLDNENFVTDPFLGEYDKHNNPNMIIAPAPDLEELWDKVLETIGSAHFSLSDDVTGGKYYCEYDYDKDLDAYGDTKEQALSNLLLKLKEAGYEV